VEVCQIFYSFCSVGLNTNKQTLGITYDEQNLQLKKMGIDIEQSVFTSTLELTLV